MSMKVKDLASCARRACEHYCRICYSCEAVIRTDLYSVCCFEACETIINNLNEELTKAKQKKPTTLGGYQKILCKRNSQCNFCPAGEVSDSQSYCVFEKCIRVNNLMVSEKG